ncbi:putative mitochondrial protein AtMg00860 [Tasmannia lanceolata]|uniref:putative mitochondrial protein AtMg00860 n=1 Tax=Tasmannia lanceolata TaxID=3420 RepID=UPI004063D846
MDSSRRYESNESNHAPIRTITKKLWPFEVFGRSFRDEFEILPKNPVRGLGTSKRNLRHESHLRVVLETLRKEQLYGELKKCEFWFDSISFLGHMVSKDGVSVDPKKIETVMLWNRPNNVLEIRNFLGLAGYYRHFVEDFSRIAAPLTRLTRKETKFVWSEDCEKSFQELK